MVFDSLDADHVRRYRAHRILSFLRDVWGDSMPDSPDPEITVLVDAVAIDDVLGGEDGVVVQGDGLTYAALAELVRRARGVRPEALLAPRLLARLDTRDDRALAPVRPVLAAPTAGAWDLDAGSRILTWDSSFARLKGAGDRGGSAPWDEYLERSIHPADQADVYDSMDRTLIRDVPFEATFRTRNGGPGWAWVRASGRRIDPPTGRGTRVIGMVAA